MSFAEDYERRNEKNVADPERARHLAFRALDFIGSVVDGMMDDINEGAKVTKDVLDQIDCMTTAAMFLSDLWNAAQKETE